MKTAALSIASSALVLGASLSALAAAPAPQPAPIVEGKGKPILLARMVVSATPLPDRPRSLPHKSQSLATHAARHFCPRGIAEDKCQDLRRPPYNLLNRGVCE